MQVKIPEQDQQVQKNIIINSVAIKIRKEQLYEQRYFAAGYSCTISRQLFRHNEAPLAKAPFASRRTRVDYTRLEISYTGV